MNPYNPKLPYTNTIFPSNIFILAYSHKIVLFLIELILIETKIRKYQYKDGRSIHSRSKD